MRVGVVGSVGSERFAENIADGLRSMGHYVVQLGGARVRTKSKLPARVAELTLQAFTRIEEITQQRIVRNALAAECEVVINVEPTLMPEAVARLRREGVRTVFWFPDPVIGLGRALMFLAPYDALFFKEPHLVERLRATTRIPVYYLPEACNPRWHRPTVPAGTEPFLIIAGNMYPSRVKLIEQLLARGIPLKIYGPNFPRWAGETPARKAHTGLRVFYADKARVFRSAAAVLNTIHPAEIAGVNGRLFQATGSGAAVLTEFRPVVPDLFKVGEEVLTYRDLDELEEQATRLLSEDGLTSRLGDAASERSHRDHTYEHRLTTILEKVS